MSPSSSTSASAASMFKGPVPPIVPFSLGSLGFMTSFLSERYREDLSSVLQGPISITLRSRLQCHIIRDTGKSEHENEGPMLVLNEVTIDRGISSFLTNLKCYCDGSFVTCVQGDGLILSTTSGSTAYSLVAGGSMVHPQDNNKISNLHGCCGNLCGPCGSVCEWRVENCEMGNFTTGKVSYMMTLVWMAIAWQACSVGVVGLIFVVSSLFSNVISTLSLAVTPIASLVAFHDTMIGVKIIAMLLALWGFASYIYQNYLDDVSSRKQGNGGPNDSC